MARDWKGWAGDVATQTLATALGTLLAAGVVVLTGAAFGLVHGLGTGEVLLIVATLLLTVATLAVTARLSYRELGERRAFAEAMELEREQNETLRQYIAEATRLAQERQRLIDEFEAVERDFGDEPPSD